MSALPGPRVRGGERCPACGWYISEEDAPPARRPWWIVLGVVLGLFAVYLWVMR